MYTFIQHLIIWIALFIVIALFAALTGHTAITTAVTFTVVGLFVRPIIEESVKPVERFVDAAGAAILFVAVLPFVLAYALIMGLVYRTQVREAAQEALSRLYEGEGRDDGPRVHSTPIVVTPVA